MITPNKTFVIVSLSEEDLLDLGYDTSELTDEDMEDLATELADDYCNNLFWSSLDIAAESEGIPKLQKQKKYGNRNICL